jgi:carbamoyltransferase
VRTIGANYEVTEFGKSLRDGGLAVVDDFEVTLAISEERLSRRKHDWGQKKALEESVGRGILSNSEFENIYWSGCCEPQRKTRRSVSHHLSHAVLGHSWSENDQSLVLVIDDGGDCLKPLNQRNEWWRVEREQLSVFVVDSTKAQLVQRDFIDPGCAGFGELYRAFTYFLGWNSGRHAGKTMALAAFGEVETSLRSIFSLENDLLTSPIKSLDPRTPHETVRRCLEFLGISGVNARSSGSPILEEHMFVAALIQHNLEIALTQKVKNAVRKFGVKDVVLTGGVALNCRAAQRVAEGSGARKVFVPPASSDQGQALGNALVGLWSNGAKEIIRLNSPYLGFEYSETLASVRRLIGELSLQKLEVTEYGAGRLVNKVARLLFGGEIVFWYQGRAEYGARALGNRSILAAPFKSETAKLLNTLKGRDQFMPFAASTLDKSSGDLFIDACRSPYMTRTFSVRPTMRAELKAVVHVDGTCRAQIISDADNRKYYNLIEAFGRLSGISAMLNTSLNGEGEPIVESPLDALKLFSKFPQVNFCVIGNVLVERQEGSSASREGMNG